MSIQSGLVRAFEDAHLAREMAEFQFREIEVLLAQWFVDSNLGARDFLREIALHQREREKAAAQRLKAQEELRAAPAPSNGLSGLESAGAA